jgi:predicted permease
MLPISDGRLDDPQGQRIGYTPTMGISFDAAIGADLRVAVRTCVRRPGIFVACIVALSLGIGAAAAVFNWCNGILLNPYPAIPESGSLVVLSSRTATGASDALAYPDIQTYRETASDLRGVVITAAAIQPLALMAEGTPAPERVLGHAVSGNYFETLRIPLVHGRGFRLEEDTTPGTHPVVIISHGLWMRRFAGNERTVGSTIQLNSQPFTIVGVASSSFAGTLLGLSVDVWTPLMMQEQLRGASLTDRRDRWLIGMARLQPGRTRVAAEAQLRAIGKRLEAADPIEDVRQPALLDIWRSPWGAQGGMGPVLTILGAVAILVLGLSSLNAANLLLAHAIERRRQFAIQLALGSKRWRLIMQLFAEGVFVAVVSCTVGLLVAIWSADLLTAFIPPTENALALNITVDRQLPLFTFALLLPIAFLVSSVAAFHSVRSEPIEWLRREGSGVSRRARSILRRGLVVAQVSLACLLIVLTSLLVRSLQMAQNISPGFSHEGVFLSQYDVSASGSTSAAQTQTAILNRLVALRLRTALASRVPLGFTPLPTRKVDVSDYASRPGEDMQVGFTVVSDGYFDTMRVPIRAGRDFSAIDDNRAPKVAIVNEAMMKRFWNDDPIGRSFLLGNDVLRVVGVVATIKQRTLNEDPLPHVYLPLAQHFRSTMILHVLAPGASSVAVDAIRASVHAELPTLPPVNVTPMSTHMRFATFAPRVTGIFLGAFASLALILAGIALFAVIAYEVTRRTSEIGLRITIGASRVQIAQLVLGDAMKMTSVGVVIGIVLALLSGRALRILLIGVSPADPNSLLTAAGVMLGVTVAACAWPLVHACKIDPCTALRNL